MNLFPGCSWVDLSPDLVAAGSTTWNVPDTFGFPVLRAFWLTSIAAGQWRGRHAHRRLSVVRQG